MSNHATHQQSSRAISYLSLGAIAAYCGWVAVFPGLASGHALNIATLTLIFAGVSTAWGMAFGLGGLFSLGHAAFFGLGAYTTAYLYAAHQVSPWIALPFAAVCAGVTGAFTTWLSARFRVRGAYFALVTLAWAEVMRVIVSNTERLGRSNGILLPFDPDAGWTDFQFRGPEPLFFLAATYALLSIIVYWGVKRSAFGWRLRAIRGSEDVASASGINVTRTLVLLMALSAAVASVGGTLYIEMVQFIDPESAFSVSVSIDIAIRAIFGGAGLVLGPLVGSGVIAWLTESLQVYLSETPSLNIMIYGLAIIAAGRLFRDGITGVLAHIAKKVFRK